jgi:hypothetical protein
VQITGIRRRPRSSMNSLKAIPTMRAVTPMLIWPRSKSAAARFRRIVALSIDMRSHRRGHQHRLAVLNGQGDRSVTRAGEHLLRMLEKLLDRYRTHGASVSPLRTAAAACRVCRQYAAG